MSHSPDIYLDYSATTPVAPEVVQAMQPYWASEFGNASSLHSFGRDAAGALAEARMVVACGIGARASEISFTGCGTESDNLAIRGVAVAMRKQRGFVRGHLITTPIEHHAVEGTVHQLHELYGFDMTLLPVNAEGQVSLNDVRDAMRPDTVLVSLIMANNEIGTVQPLAAIGALCRERGIPFHTDAVQVPAYMPIDVNALNVDLMALSAHKLYGPKGVGVLYIREGTPYIPAITGGGHERGRRPGTVNVAGAVGTAAAIKYVSRERDGQAARLTQLRDQLIEGVLSRVPDSRLTGHRTERLPHHTSFVFKDVDGAALLMSLDIEGIACSTGSACTSGNPEPSPVLVALGIPIEWSLGGLRITLGYHTVPEDIERVLAVLPMCVERVRQSALEFAG